MFMIPPKARVYVAAEPGDMRKSFDTLAALVRQKIKADPLCGHLFVFCNKSRNVLKVLVWDGTGLWVLAKRLEKGRFVWPRAAPGEIRVELTAAELAALLSGLDPRRAAAWPAWHRISA
jgi:transposase